MSYYAGNYFKNYSPVYGPEGDIGEPVPGWGPLPHMAGPKMVGVGDATFSAKNASRFLKGSGIKLEIPPTEEEEGSAVPWWVWIAGAAAIGGGALFASSKGWI